MRHPLHSICPYFAMFPESFVNEQIQQFTRPNDWVFDPFSGRGTTLFESLLRGRRAAATDVNPVAFCLTRAKADPPALCEVEARLDSLAVAFAHDGQSRARQEAAELPAFFRRAYHHATLRELLFLRRALGWRAERVDAFIAAMVLGSLHGEMDRSSAYFSNQMPRTICLKPDYSLRYWRRHRLFARRRAVFAMLREKACFRLASGRAELVGITKLADARQAAFALPELRRRIRLVVTSPPYLDVTRFEEDQWLRLWFLGHEPRPTYGSISRDDRHVNAERYWSFLAETWDGLSALLAKDAVIVIRIGTKSLSLRALSDGLLHSLAKVFPQRSWLKPPRVSAIQGRQARAFNPHALGCKFEGDFTFAPYRTA